MARSSTEGAARGCFEAVRWPHGVTCPHCGNADSARIYTLTANPEAKIRSGMHKCAECRETFTVTVGTVMEDSHVPLHKWLIAFYMMCASKTQIAALQLQRQLELGSYRTALFLCHRIRFALMDFFPSRKLAGTVEADETYLRGKIHGRGRGYVKNKTPVVALVERGNAKRSIDGTHHRISRRHTGLYLAELDHKYNTRKLSDGQRTVVGIRKMEGKRLTLHRPKAPKVAQ